MAFDICTEGFRQIKGKTYRFRSFFFVLPFKIAFLPTLDDHKRTPNDTQRSGEKSRWKNSNKKIDTGHRPSSKSTTYVYWEKQIYCANANPERPNTSWRRAKHTIRGAIAFGIWKTFWNTHARACTTVVEPVFGPNEFSETNTSKTYL